MTERVQYERLHAASFQGVQVGLIDRIRHDVSHGCLLGWKDPSVGRFADGTPTLKEDTTESFCHRYGTSSSLRLAVLVEDPATVFLEGDELPFQPETLFRP